MHNLNKFKTQFIATILNQDHCTQEVEKLWTMLNVQMFWLNPLFSAIGMVLSVNLHGNVLVMFAYHSEFKTSSQGTAFYKNYLLL